MKANQFNTLAKVPFGSRLYGTFTETSDWDWKVLYLPDLSDVLYGERLTNKFYSTSNDAVKNTSEDTDTELISVQQFAKDFLDGQTYALEMAFAIMNSERVPGLTLYSSEAKELCQFLVRDFLTSNIKSMVGYAIGQAQIYSDKGHRLDALYALQKYITDLLANEPDVLAIEDKFYWVIDHFRGHERGYMWLDQYKDHITFNDDQKNDTIYVESLVVLGKYYPGTVTIGDALERIAIQIKKYGKRAHASMESGGRDWKAISHAVRVTHQALEVLNKHTITLPFAPSLAEHLRSIKAGKIEFEVVEEELLNNLELIEQAQKTTTLPSKTAEMTQMFKDDFKIVLRGMYGFL